MTCRVITPLIVGVLLYFSDGLLPLLRAYYETFFEPPQDAYSRERQMETSAKIAAALMVWEVININRNLWDTWSQLETWYFDRWQLANICNFL